MLDVKVHISENTKITNFKHPLPSQKKNQEKKNQYNWSKVKIMYWWVLIILYYYWKKKKQFYINHFLFYNLFNHILIFYFYRKDPIDSNVVIIPLTKLKSTHNSLTRFPVPLDNDQSHLQEFFLNFHLLRMYEFESRMKLLFFPF